MSDATEQLESIDTSDVDRWVGQPVGGSQLKDPVTRNDIRRWAQGMQNPNPLYIDEEFAAESELGEFVAPQSFTICADVGHGATPAIQGTIPGSHMLFGGDEWWFFGPRIRPGDTLRSERLAFDYKIAHTSFAGPTMFQRGDTTYVNQRGEIVAKQRSTSIRYLVANAKRMNSLQELEREPEWTDEELMAVDREKLEYYATFHDHVTRYWKDVNIGDRLPQGVIGPHSIQSFSTEWRSYLFTIWGSAYPDGRPTSTSQAGWLPEMSRDEEASKIDPAHADGLYHGASRGHTIDRYAKVIGVPRAYGYGASMGAWVLDYVTNWAGEKGFVTHSNISYRHPPLVGDVTYLNAEVEEKFRDGDSPKGLVKLKLQMTTQTGVQMARGTVEVKLPA
ncbi:MAG TPA: MaoC family dehydratase N-terminal domain-containing protein [Gemmatimonadales bacterium]|nr:MaoC family dehydratase N-terminal domain-containing protein [Gemmatimonadales bacterium]